MGVEGSFHRSDRLASQALQGMVAMDLVRLECWAAGSLAPELQDVDAKIRNMRWAFLGWPIGPNMGCEA